MSLYITNDGEPKIGAVIISVIIFTIILAVSLMAIRPKYNVWQQGLEGEAEYRKAEQIL